MIIHNQSNAPVVDYPISDPKTKEVLAWTIKPGQTLEFPDYVGEYLTEVYGFLQRVITKEQRQAEIESQQRIDQNRHFDPVKIVDNNEAVSKELQPVSGPIGGYMNNQLQQPPSVTQPEVVTPGPGSVELVASPVGAPTLPVPQVEDVIIPQVSEAQSVAPQPVNTDPNITLQQPSQRQ